MSSEQTKAFIEKMKIDDIFRDKVMGLKNVQERIDMIRKEGYECSIEDLERFQEELNDIEQGQVKCGFCAPRDLPEKPVV